jgi:hypothetical protein
MHPKNRRSSKIWRADWRPLIIVSRMEQTFQRIPNKVPFVPLWMLQVPSAENSTRIQRASFVIGIGGKIKT